MRKIVISWSGGKDSMIALHRLSQKPDVEIAGLMSAFRGPEAVIGLHNTPRSLIQAQADALQLPLFAINLSAQAPNTEYEQKHMACFDELKKAGIHEVAFGDIHLEPIKAYRDQLLEKAGMAGCFPLWQEEPEALLSEFMQAGYRSVITAIDWLTVPETFIGQTLDWSMAEHLKQKGLDACGENGEYHSFVYDGPMFQKPLAITLNGYQDHDYRPDLTMYLRTAEMTLSSAASD